MIDGFVQATLDGRIVDCNEIFSAMLGYSKAELLQITYL